MSMLPNNNLFAKFKRHHRVYIETGTFSGDSLDLAWQAGFRRLYGVDCDAQKIMDCIYRFKLDDKDSKTFGRIDLCHSDSVTWLREKLSRFDEACMFWLDAHSQHLDHELPGDNPYPLLDELAAIGQHHIKSHTILIDDILHLTHPEITGWTRKNIEEAVYRINPDYKIEYFANPVRNNILLAHI